MPKLSILTLALLFLLLFGCNSQQDKQKEEVTVAEVTQSDSGNVETEETAAAEEEVSAVSWQEQMPADEKNIVDIMTKAWAKSEYSYTESEKYKLMKERKNTLRNGYQMSDWVGTVWTSEYNQEANEINLVIVLYQGDDLYETVQVGTGTSADSKYRAPTTIKEGSALFDKALDLNPDDKVKFSGTLYLKDYSPWSADRADDNPLDGFGQLSFLTKFSKLEKLE